jgi:hypothetical protein
MSKNALCIGINDYPGTNMDLRGCVNDAKDWAKALGDRDFKVKSILDAEASKQKMVEAIGDLISGAKSGDTVAITFSGHGTYAPDDDGDEVDALDEALCPHDIKEGHALFDDEIRELFSQRAARVRILLVSDSCHSGTVTRAAPAEDSDGPRVRFLPMAAWLPEKKLPRGGNGKPLARIALPQTKSPWSGVLSGGDLLISGCQEGPDNYSYDASFGGRPSGAFTYYALKALKNLGANATYAEWHQAIRNSLPSMSYPQSPQLVGSKSARRSKLFL